MNGILYRIFYRTWYKVTEDYIEYSVEHSMVHTNTANRFILRFNLICKEIYSTVLLHNMYKILQIITWICLTSLLTW
jgi:hypothetical protein